MKVTDYVIMVIVAVALIFSICLGFVVKGDVVDIRKDMLTPQQLAELLLVNEDALRSIQSDVADMRDGLLTTTDLIEVLQANDDALQSIQSVLEEMRSNSWKISELKEVLRANDDALQNLDYDHRLDKSLNDLFIGTGREPGETTFHRIDLDQYWDADGFYLPDGAGCFRATSRKAFSYPIVTFYTKLPTMTEDNHFWLGLITEPDGVNSVACFEWDRGRFMAQIGDLAINTTVNISSFLPSSYDTARHRYSIKVNRSTVEFYVDYQLVAIGMGGLLPRGIYTKLSENSPPYAVFGNFEPLMANSLSAFVEIDTDGGDLLLPIDLTTNSFSVAEGDPQPARQYVLYNENTQTLWVGQSVSAKIISHPIPIKGYSSKTLLFQTGGEGTLDIMVYAGRDWRLYKSVSVSANTLVTESISCEAPFIRCEYTPNGSQTICVSEFNMT
ncbi:hypothetical protein ACFLXE_08580 [Chloroflexota bacterium]